METFSRSGGNRTLRIKSSRVRELLSDDTLTQFEKHIIQEGVKQVLYGQGTEELTIVDSIGFERTFLTVTDEMIDFLRQYEIFK
jgi:ferredoxin-fold anticodon binding domain-containing protein